MNRKFFAVVLIALALTAETASASTVEVLGNLNLDEESYAAVLKSSAASDSGYLAGVDINNIIFKYYDSMPAMMLALTKGEIDFVDIPRTVGRYVLENSSDAALMGLGWWPIRGAAALHFGFLDENAELAS